jgi:hypothetical protein
VYASQQLVAIPIAQLVRNSEEVHTYMSSGAYLGQEYKQLMESKLNANTSQIVSEFFDTNVKKFLFNLHIITVVEQFELLEPYSVRPGHTQTTINTGRGNALIFAFIPHSYDGTLSFLAVKNARRRE